MKALDMLIKIYNRTMGSKSTGKELLSKKWEGIGYDLQESVNFHVRNLTAKTNFQNNLAKAASPPTPACV